MALKSPVVGTYVGEELFSAPLMRAFRDLYPEKSKESIDTIILDAMVHVGSHLTMPIMAQSILNEAKKADAADANSSISYYETFKKYFAEYGIVKA